MSPLAEQPCRWDGGAAGGMTAGRARRRRRLRLLAAGLVAAGFAVAAAGDAPRDGAGATRLAVYRRLSFPTNQAARLPECREIRLAPAGAECLATLPALTVSLGGVAAAGLPESSGAIRLQSPTISAAEAPIALGVPLRLETSVSAPALCGAPVALDCPAREWAASLFANAPTAIAVNAGSAMAEEQTLAAIALAPHLLCAPALVAAGVEPIRIAATPDPGSGGTAPIALACRSAVFPGLREIDRALVSTVMERAKAGEINRRSPALRGELVWFLAQWPFTEEAYEVFRFVLEGAAGNTPRRRTATLVDWAQEYAGGRYAAIVLYYAAYHCYRTGAYDEALERADAYLALSPEAHDRVHLLRALCRAQRNEPAAATEILDKIEAGYPQSPMLPEAAFLKAWLRFQEGKTADAQRMLAELLRQYPQSPSATKARQILDNLGAKK